MAERRVLERTTASDLFLLLWDDYRWSTDICGLAILDGDGLLDGDGRVRRRGRSSPSDRPHGPASTVRSTATAGSRSTAAARTSRGGSHTLDGLARSAVVVASLP
jgi:hypothetical protein